MNPHVPYHCEPILHQLDHLEGLTGPADLATYIQVLATLQAEISKRIAAAAAQLPEKE